jgi:site-specific recombinase XerD
MKKRTKRSSPQKKKSSKKKAPAQKAKKAVARGKNRTIAKSKARSSGGSGSRAQVAKTVKIAKITKTRGGGLGLFLLKSFKPSAGVSRGARAGARQSIAAPRGRRSSAKRPVSGFFSAIRGGAGLAKSESIQPSPSIPKSAEVMVQVPPPVPALEVSAPTPEATSLTPMGGSQLPQEVRPLTQRLTTRDLLRPHDDLKQSIEGFLLDQRSPHTRRAYGKDLKRFIQFLIVRKQKRNPENRPDHPLANWDEVIDRHLIIAYKESLLSEGLEHTTVDRHLATLRSFFKWLVDDGRIDRSPVEGVRFLNPKRLSTTIGFTDEEVRKVVAVPDIHTRTGALHHAVLNILFYCGLRRSELCGLRTSNVGMERGFPILRLRGKGNAERLVAIPEQAWQSLQHYLKISRKDPSQDQYLFTPIRNNRGGGVLDKPLDPSMIFYIVTKCAKTAGVANRVSPHSCRATAISNARDHQVSDRAIQEFAGWASPDMITRYDKRKNAIENSASLAIRYEAEED